MQPLRRAACRLLSSPAPLPLRSRLVSASSAHRLVGPRRTFIQSRLVAEEAKDQLKAQNAASTTASAAATTPAASQSTMTESEEVREGNSTITTELESSNVAGVEGTSATMEIKSSTVVEEAREVEDFTDTARPGSSTPVGAGRIQEKEEEEEEHPVTRVIIESSTMVEPDEARDAEDTTATTSATTSEEGQLSVTDDVAQTENDAEDYAERERIRLENARIDELRQAQFTPKDTIFIGNLFYDVTADDLKAQMSKFGIVMAVHVVYDSRGISKGFGYVQFENKTQASKAIEAMHMRIFEGRRVTLYYARSNLRSTKLSRPSKVVYVGNMPFEMTDRDLNELFRGIVNVIDVRVSMDRQTGEFLGYIHAEFTDAKSAAIGLEQLALKEPYGRKLKVNFSNNIRTTKPAQAPAAQ
ncbi:nucleic acid-binding protein [Aspergillus lucknowensis]|uniref:RRM domain-containing protein n=1 Tax=Aspergillus lucknowensis TaxID=176173 RepID=A0ABR4M026_9EURO